MHKSDCIPGNWEVYKWYVEQIPYQKGFNVRRGLHKKCQKNFSLRRVCRNSIMKHFLNPFVNDAYIFNDMKANSDYMRLKDVPPS